MAQSSLVVDRIGAGEDLIESLRAVNFPIEVAFWTQDDDGSWQFVLASPEVDRRGDKYAYGILVERLRGLESWSAHDQFAIRMVGVKKGMGKAMSSYADRFVGNAMHWAGGIYHGDVVLGQTFIYPKNMTKEPRP